MSNSSSTVSSTLNPHDERNGAVSPEKGGGVGEGLARGFKDMMKISAPQGGAPIPAGFKFGAKDEVSGEPKDRDRKAKSGRWGFGGFGKISQSFFSPYLLIPRFLKRCVSANVDWPSRILLSSAGSSSANPLPQARPVFGVPLPESLAVAQIAGLPAVIFRCIEYLEARHAEEEEGIYRMSGSNTVIKALKARFNDGSFLESLQPSYEIGLIQLTSFPSSRSPSFNTVEGDVNLLEEGEMWDPHAICGVLKVRPIPFTATPLFPRSQFLAAWLTCYLSFSPSKGFLRELTTSILTPQLHMHFLAVMDLVDPHARISELRHLVSDLPEANYSLLRALTAHLILVIENAAVNKMTLRNVSSHENFLVRRRIVLMLSDWADCFEFLQIGIVFSPTLGVPAGVFSELVTKYVDEFFPLSLRPRPFFFAQPKLIFTSCSDPAPVQLPKHLRRPASYSRSHPSSR
jgi:RalA-binding protein 1